MARIWWLEAPHGGPPHWALTGCPLLLMGGVGWQASLLAGEGGSRMAWGGWEAAELA